MSTMTVGRDLTKQNYQPKKKFQSNLSMENITDADFKHAKKV